MNSIRVYDRTFTPFLHRTEIETLVSDIARRINRDFAGKELTVLVILKGAFVFAADLIRLLDMPVTVEVLRASSYGSAMSSSGTVVIDDSLVDVSERHIMIVEDIVDTGTTLVQLIKQLGGMNPASVTVTSLLSKPTQHHQELNIDYVGREIPAEFVVGYGMDYAGYGRNLDSIWVVRDEPASDASTE